LVTDEFKYHNLCLKYAPFCLTQVWICLHESPTTFSCCNIIASVVIELHLVYE